MQLRWPKLLHNPKKPDFEGSDYFMNGVDAFVGIQVAPSIHPHAAGDCTNQAALEKEGWRARAGQTR